MERKIDRLDKYMEIKGLNDNKITVKAGLSVGIIGKSRKKDRDLGANAIEQILYSFPDINASWLLTGEGEMLKSEEKPIIPFNSTDTVPMSVLQFIMESSKTASSQIDELIRQNAVLVDTVKNQTEIIKKTMNYPKPDVLQEDNVTCADASGSDLEK